MKKLKKKLKKLKKDLEAKLVRVFKEYQDALHPSSLPNNEWKGLCVLAKCKEM